MYTRLSFVAAATFGFATIITAVESVEPTVSFKVLVYRDYLINAAGVEVAIKESRYVFQRRDLDGKTHFLLTIKDIRDGTVMRVNIPVTVTRKGNLVQFGQTTWKPFEPRVPEDEDQSRVDYQERDGTDVFTGRAEMSIRGYPMREYAGRIFQTMKVRVDITEDGTTVRHKCIFIPEIRNIGSCRFESEGIDEETRLVAIEY